MIDGLASRRKTAVELTLDTPMTPQECRAALQAILKPLPPWYVPDVVIKDDTYRGTIDAEGRFRIIRSISVREAALATEDDLKNHAPSNPVFIRGEIAPAQNGARISVILTPAPFSRGIKWFCYLIGVFMAFGTLGNLLDPEVTVVRMIGMAAMTLGFFVLPFIASRYTNASLFDRETVRAQQFLTTLFKAENVMRLSQNDK